MPLSVLMRASAWGWNLTAVIGKHRRIPSREVEGASLGVTDEDRSTGRALVEVEPFLSLTAQSQTSTIRMLQGTSRTHIRMPVQLPQSLRLKLHNRRGESLTNGKIATVNLAECASVSGDRFGRMVVCVVDVGRVALQCSQRCFAGVGADGAV